MIDPLEADLTLSDAAALVPGRPCNMTVWRWATKGIRGIRLQTVKIAGVRYTTREALRAFLSSVNDAADGHAPQPRSPQEREKAIKAAVLELEKSGI